MDIGALTGLVAVTLGILVVLIPIAGLTARFALKPIVEAFARVKEINGEEQKVALMEQRIALLEEHLHMVDRNMATLQEDADFRRQLESGNRVAQPPYAS
jgi:monomeric isocitrate dehydrogenase